MKVEITKMKGGYLLQNGYHDPEIVTTTVELFETLLLLFEGRAAGFHDGSYVQVTINREEPTR